MATGGAEDPDEPVCAVCMDPYKDPRFLPSCYHTFCATCIQDLSDKHDGGKFPCPYCRKTSRLPPGGTRELQINFYINTQKKMQATATNVPPGQLMCPVHDDEKLRFYCTKCQQVICLHCKLTQHEGHPTEDLKTAEARIKNKMVLAEKIVTGKLKKYNDRLNVVQRRKDDAFQKKAAVEKSIRDRHATLVAAADKARDEALKSLNNIAVHIADDYKTEMDNYTTSHKFQSACYTQCKLNAVSSKSIVQLVEVAKAMDTNLEMDDTELQRQLEDTFPDDTDIGVVRSATHRVHDDDTVKMAVQMAREFMGSVVKTEVLASQSDVTVVERFSCAADGDHNIRIFHVCNDDKRVWVSYDHCGLDDNVVERVFDETGRYMTGEVSGKVTNKRCNKGESMYPKQKKGCLFTDTKSLTAGHFRLKNDLSGTANIKSIKVVSFDPYKKESKIEFQIKVGGHRVVDVDDTEQLFVVVEEPQAPDGKRRVQLYRRGEEGTVTTYRSPVQPFQPSDVCFYILGNQRRLLVADEANDSIHVVKVSSDSLTFDRYLVPGCPCLVQPTALNVDTKGRLWVACRGGKIITMENKV